MKKFITTLLLFSALSLPTFAQEITKKASDRGSDIEVTDQEYERMIENKILISTRAQAINSLELTEEQTENFTPLLMEYTKYKEALQDRRSSLLKEYAKEMKEDNSRKSEMNETGDFIENFWEADIAEMELRKDYFDRFEDVITPEKALRFFANEEMYTRRAKRALVMEQLPEMIFLVPAYVTYQQEINDFNDWNRINIDGKVGLDHEFTYNGLAKLLNAAEAMAMAEGIEVNNFEAKKADVMMLAEQLKINWTSVKHADYARKAFVHTAEILNAVAKDARFTVSNAWLSKLKTTAEMIDPAKKLTNQASTVYTYFNTAESIVNELAAQVNEVK